MLCSGPPKREGRVALPFGFESPTVPKPAPSAKLGRTSATLASVRSNARGSLSSARTAYFPSIDTLADLVNIGTLFAFILVAIGVLLLRRADPDRPRPFRTPFMPVLPIVSVLLCIWLMVTLSGTTWIRFIAWMVIGFFVYGLYSRHRSRVA